MGFSITTKVAAISSLVIASGWITPQPAMADITDPHLQASEPIQPLPPKPRLNPAEVALGKALFADTRLSHDNSLACTSCHSLKLGGANGLPRSVGINGAKSRVNVPTVLNSGYSFVQFWDGRAANLEEQATVTFFNPKVMGSSPEEILAKLRRDPAYPGLFAALYADGIQISHVAEAIATYERSLTTPDGPFDRFLKGDGQAISADAKLGYQKFKELGCASCHQGQNVGGNMLQKFGVMLDYFADRKEPVSEADWGRFNVTHQEEDRFVFKVPSLRNIADTGPYFHDAGASTLEEAVRIMAKYQLGRDLTPSDEKVLVAFLRSLSAGSVP